jgi:hypothetical protein
VPAKRDLFAICEELGTRAGMVTIFRGWFMPNELNYTPDKYPAMGFVEEGESIRSGSLGHDLEGSIALDIWAHAKHVRTLTTATGMLTIPDPASMVALDDLHDRFLDFLSDSYPELTSQTISIYPEESNAWTNWWYVETPHVGGRLRLHWKMTRAPNPH